MIVMEQMKIFEKKDLLFFIENDWSENYPITIERKLTHYIVKMDI